MTQLQSLARRFVREQEGATMVEYALLVALIGVVLIAAWQGLANKIGGTANAAGDKMPQT